MKKNKKLNSIATMSKKELQEVNGGMYMVKRYPDIFPEGQPVPMYSASSTHVLNQGESGRIAGMMNPGMIGMIR